VARSELPEEPKALAMLAQEGVGLEDQKAFFPIVDATGEEDEPEAIGLRKGRFVDLAVEDDQLLPKQGILGHAVRSAAREVGGGAENNRIARRLGEVQKGLSKERTQTGEQLGKQMKECVHVIGLQKSCQKLSADCIRCTEVNFPWDGVFSQHKMAAGMLSV